MNYARQQAFGGQGIGYSETVAARKLAEMEKAERAVNVPQAGDTLLSELSQRLMRIHELLVDGNGRMERVADRVFGTEQPATGGTSAADTAAHTINALLGDLVIGIEVQAQRLHGIASRIERIG